MKILRKEGDSIQLLCFLDEDVEKGDYVLIKDGTKERALIAQIIDVQYANIPGILEDLLRDGISEGILTGEDIDPFKVSSQIEVLKDTRLLVGKIRGALQNGRLSRDVSWLPSRIHAHVEVMSPTFLTGALSAKHPFELGVTRRSSIITSDLAALDGRLNVITGRKGTGKSHLSKLLVTTLVKQGAPVVVLDVNGEYVNLGRTHDGREQLSTKILPLIPGVNLRFSLDEIGLSTFLGILVHALSLPDNSSRVFARIWHQLEQQNGLTMNALGAAIAGFECHESIKDALQARFNTLDDSGIFTNDHQAALNLEEVFRNRNASGVAIVVNMKNQPSTLRRITVELLISKLTDLLSSHRLNGIFLFAEEAHLYLRETYWDDIVTRMRHLGLFATFITNQPDTIDGGIYRQADNIFLFNFSNEHDLEIVSKVAKLDAETIRMIVRDLPPQRCLAVGDLVSNFPMIINVRPLEMQTLGATRYFFQDQIAVA